uniref:NADH-ubiquinone oxidoreductase chain 3 n=1 Tax=Phyllocoptes taishanensis TaxID=1638174 RepID=A0A0U2HVH7_9ACAR|nr:NADH dehydrogenase subunit 3 [Phyllocoptes taishanensis]ALK03801.1 NADH dehydrogenase subunit 3 [Phyllocoptes taishanensis]
MFLILSYSFLLCYLIYLLFMMASTKSSWEATAGSPFECGFTSYFFSRFSFSVHYFLVGLIFLFFDLELTFMMPFFNESLSSLILGQVLLIFIVILLSGLLMEWKEGGLDWS